VRNELSALAGITVKDVHIGSAVVEYDEQPGREDQIRQAVERAGYRVIPQV
jgi:hypothetical protein